ncbi:NADPH:quinone oxidoreductase family protein [Frigidibacter sp. ROC022]|uniref:NADPH:quinone oxidoreductase family protein n=1 Tax=Frigidibacter sp. ROC022 TaxID=2971796 RepID=UPI00215B4F47|nr:NADPH:quinone oxidoreductase family protein [Frigidibacter sp. ROC022]MCR8726759.1 NADPH:quinone oxidoreductase family protein [Frigidibacter sp. ROC022]
MRAIVVKTLGQDPEWGQSPDPVPGPGEVLVRIAAAGLNFADLLMIEGRYQVRPPLPFVPGLEAAGTVIALGPGTQAPAVGSRVMVIGGEGTLAELAAVPAERCLPIPETMDFATAAAFPVAYGTSHLALTRRARLEPEETLLVLGAAGGVGLTAVEIGHAMGARVIAAARGAAKLEVARAAGADHLIDSGSEDLREAVKALGGCDVVYDPVGGDLFTAALRACRPEARILTIGFASGTVPPVPANILLVKNVSVLGFYWGGYMAFNPAAVTESLAQLTAWHTLGRLKPHISHLLPPERLDEGLAAMRGRTSTGKIVIRFTDEE